MENCPYPRSSQQYFIYLLDHTLPTKEMVIEQLREAALAPKDPSKLSFSAALSLEYPCIDTLIVKWRLEGKNGMEEWAVLLEEFRKKWKFRKLRERCEVLLKEVEKDREAAERAEQVAV